VTGPGDLARLKGKDDIHDHLAPVYGTLRRLAGALPGETALIGFAGAPWTVATYMIAGRGTPDQAPAHALRRDDPETFDALIDLLTGATVEYLDQQVRAGAEVVKLFDSWAGSLEGDAFARYALDPVRRIVAALKARHPGLPIIAFPREAGAGYVGFAKAVGADGLAIDTRVDPAWAAERLQGDSCVQGNLDPGHMITGGDALVAETRRIVEALKGGPHIFNLGHGITPEADPDNVHLLLETIRGRPPAPLARGTAGG